MRTGIEAMVASLDPYTNYISESEIEDYRFMTTGQYGGVGASIFTRNNYVEIKEVYEGFAAQKAGLRAGDILMEIDGKSVKGKNTGEVSKFLKGQAGSTIKVLFKRPSESQSRSITLAREEIQIDNEDWADQRYHRPKNTTQKLLIIPTPTVRNFGSRSMVAVSWR
jgi:carboxyl-terminal processing protease